MLPASISGVQYCNVPFPGKEEILVQMDKDQSVCEEVVILDDYFVFKNIKRKCDIPATVKPVLGFDSGDYYIRVRERWNPNRVEYSITRSQLMVSKKAVTSLRSTKNLHDEEDFLWAFTTKEQAIEQANKIENDLNKERMEYNKQTYKQVLENIKYHRAKELAEEDYKKLSWLKRLLMMDNTKKLYVLTRKDAYAASLSVESIRKDVDDYLMRNGFNPKELGWHDMPLL